MVEIIVVGSIAILFVALGIAFLQGKGAFLIAGYNTMSEEEKAKINERMLLQTMCKLTIALAFTMLLWLLSSSLNIDWLFYIGIVIFILLTISTIIRVNTGSTSIFWTHKS